MQIGRAIKELRQERGLKQNEFAERCGLSQSYLSHIEKGTKEPTLNMLKQISSALDIPMPILVFMSMESEDVSESKRQAFELLEPSIKGLISDVFTKEAPTP